LLNHQRDILSPKAIEEVEGSIAETRRSIVSAPDNAALHKQMEALEASANKWIKPYPNAAWRENIEVLLVALAVAMAVRTFFLQPFKIPTGSMQPTLFGVTHVNLINNPNFKIPSGWQRVKEWFQGTSYIHIVAKSDGELVAVNQPTRFLIFNIRQTLVVGDQTYTIWFPPDYGDPQRANLQTRAGLQPRGFGDLGRAMPGQMFHAGEDIVKLKIDAGDHLFVDRVSYNFRPPERGEIVVFETRGIEQLPRDQQETFYIKRLVGLGGETLSLQQEFIVTNGFQARSVGHLVVNGVPLSASTPHFENLYSFNDAPRGAKILPYVEDRYFGHWLTGYLSPGEDYKISPEGAFVMGDNTMNSLDSRYWGDFPKRQIIGKSFFVYWPITDRFGCGSSAR
jgi:signal peptidase I